jgi:hypothetical protein
MSCGTMDSPRDDPNVVSALRRRHVGRGGTARSRRPALDADGVLDDAGALSEAVDAGEVLGLFE